MDKKFKLKTELAKKLKKETSVTGTGASVTPGTGEGVATKYAFGKRDNKGTPKDWKADPSIPNRPSKTMDYKELWEEINEDSSTDEILTYLQAAKQNGTLSPDAQEVLLQWMNTPGASREEIIKVLRKLTGMYLKEGYAQFRNETKMRSKPDQFHQAVKQIKKKMNEINRIFEYVDRLKSELSEGEDLKYKKYTENAFSQIKESAKSLFLKSTKLK
jgi:hypothetical protein